MVADRGFVHLEELNLLANSTKPRDHLLVYFDMKTHRESQLATELNNLMRQLVESIDERRSFIQMLERLLGNLLAYKTREELKGLAVAVTRFQGCQGVRGSMIRSGSEPIIGSLKEVSKGCICTPSSTDLVPPFSDPESVIRNRRRNLGDPSLLLDFEEIYMNPNNVQGPPHAGPPPQNHNGPPGLNFQNSAPDLRTMEELCQPTMNGRGGPIAPVNIQATDFRLKSHMIQ
ncbi:hypothetical protein Tco_0792110 [Tanacetum coccineum]